MKGGDNNDKYASMIFANETWNKLGEMGLHDLVFLWPNVNAHGTEIKKGDEWWIEETEQQKKT